MTRINPKWRNLVSSFHRFTQGNSELQLHAGEVLPGHPSFVQQQGKAGYLGERTSKGRGHQPGVHHTVSRYVKGLRLILGRVLILLLGVGDAASRNNTHTLTDELFFSAHRSQGEKEMQGIIVSYKVKVNLMVSSGG